ncbi:MAG: hypothetical protein R3194_09305 [Limnobacter sp.]|nr:hypothetical protein [Limnobacter sp.]
MIKKAQNFIFWYIPAIIGTHFVTVALLFTGTGSISFGHRVDFLLSNLGAIVCCIWLFFNSEKQNLNKWLWGIFGLGAHLFAVVLFFIVAFNQSLKRTG